jgi:hypothetical protein
VAVVVEEAELLYMYMPLLYKKYLSYISTMLLVLRAFTGWPGRRAPSLANKSYRDCGFWGKYPFVLAANKFQKSHETIVFSAKRTGAVLSEKSEIREILSKW